MLLSLEADLPDKGSSIEISDMLTSYLPLEHVLLNGGDRPRDAGLNTTDTFRSLPCSILTVLFCLE
jgi:hypothetical protein